MDFANILFAGPCNRSCPFCIGREIPSRVNINNLALFPPLNLFEFIRAINERRIKQIVFTGTTSDPQMYRHEAELLRLLRYELHEDAVFSVHTNGVLSIRKIDVFNQYDRACISFPSFDSIIYEKMMGSKHVPDLAAIVKAARIPVKVSCVINEYNADQIFEFMDRMVDIGVRRLVLRQLFGDVRDWNPFDGEQPERYFRSNPVYDYRGLEVTYWDFDESACTSLNLFPDGTIGQSYLLTENFAPPLEASGRQAISTR